MPRFVILHHDWPSPHHDLMLEADGVLRTWRLASLDGGDAEKLDDHRLAYLDYEGPVSGGRGTVRRYDHGEFNWLVDEPYRLEIACNGQRVIGVVSLRKINEKCWRISI